MEDHEIYYSTGLKNYEIPPVAARTHGCHLSTSDIGAVDYIAGASTSSALTTTTPTANTTFVWFVPFVSPNIACKIDQIQFEVTAVQATAEGYIGVFENIDNSAPHIPDTLLPGNSLYASTAQQCNSGNGLRTVGSLTLQLKPNRVYWMGLYIYPQLATNITLRAMNSSQVFYGASETGTTTGGAVIFMSVNSSINPVSWGDCPRMHGTTWAPVATFPVLRYRLIP